MKKRYSIQIQFADPNAPKFTEPQIEEVIKRAIAFYNQKSLIVDNPKSIIDSRIDPYTLTLMLESGAALPYPGKALQVFSRYLVNPKNEGALNRYIYGKQLFKMAAEEIDYEPDTPPSSELSLGQNNKDDINGKGKNMKITIEDLLRDRKENALDAQDKIDLILRYFTGLENKVFNEKEYRALGWYETEYFDVINSFYTTYKCALEAYHFKTYTFKENYAKKALVEGYQAYNDLKELKKMKLGSLFEELAKLTHCVANFMPCPSWDFNAAKGTSIAHDFLPVFVDLIQAHVDANAKDDRVSKYYGNLKYGDNNEIKISILIKWKEWLINNVDKYCLSCYYEVREGKLKGKPLFKKKDQSGEQSLDYPYPQEPEEVNECVSNMINCIKIRADELLCRINEQETPK